MEEIRDAAARVAARLNRDHADLVEVTARLIDNDAWGCGYRSPEHWLVVNVGLSPARAKDIVRLARRRDELPTIMTLLDQSKVSVDQAAVVARRVPASHQASVAEIAAQMTVPQLTRVLARYVFTVPDAATDTTPAHVEPETAEQRAAAPATLSTHDDENGRFHLRYHAPAEVGALVEQAINEAKDALFTAGQSDATPADALADALTDGPSPRWLPRSLAAVTSPSRRDRYRVYLHLSTDGAVGQRRRRDPTPPGQGGRTDYELRRPTTTTSTTAASTPSPATPTTPTASPSPTDADYPSPRSDHPPNGPTPATPPTPAAPQTPTQD